VFYTPDGRLFEVPQPTVREQQLGAIIQGARWAKGSVILGYGVVLIGAAALAAPAVAAAAAETLATVMGAPGVTAVTEGIMTSRYFVWVTLHWQAVFAWGSFGVGLATKIRNFSPSAFLAEFRESPGDALKGLGMSFVETMHDFGEAYTSTPSAGHGGGDAEEPHTPSNSRGGGRAATRALPSAPSGSGEGDELTRARMIGGALQKSARATNDNSAGGGDDDAPAISLPQAVAENDQMDLRARRTGTDDAPAGDVAEPTGPVTYRPSASQKPTRPAGPAEPDAADEAARGKSTGRPTASQRSAGTAPRRQSLGQRPISMRSRVGGLNARMQGFLKRAATIFREELTRRRDSAAPDHEVSSEAHKDALDRLRAEYGDVTEHGQPLTGVSGPGTNKKPNQRIADATYVDLDSPKRQDTPADFHVEFKLKAYVEDGGKVLVASGGNSRNVTTGQMQAYDVGRTELGVPTFVINGRGQIFAFSRGRWVVVGGPE
jgi:hypothetical protein